MPRKDTQSELSRINSVNATEGGFGTITRHSAPLYGSTQSTMLNKVMLIGYVGADSEMKFTSGGIPVANFSLAVKEVYKNGDGEKKTNTLWIRCVAWRRWAEIVGEHVIRGKFLFIEGRLQLRSYEDRNGEKREVTEVVISTLRFLGPPKNGNGTKAPESSKAAEPSDEADNPFNAAGSETADLDVPF